MISRRRSDALSEDSLVTQISALSELSFEDRLNWIAYVRARMSKRLAELGHERPRSRFQITARDASLAMIETRVEWLDRLREAVLSEWHGRTGINS